MNNKPAASGTLAIMAMEAKVIIPLHEYERLQQRITYLEGFVQSGNVRITGSQLNELISRWDAFSLRSDRKITGANLAVTTTIEGAEKLINAFGENWFAEKAEYERLFDGMRTEINNLERECALLKLAAAVAAKRSWFSKLFSRNN